MVLSEASVMPLTVSIPSSRVGTLVAVFNYDEAKLVSIPSSRVGTRAPILFAAADTGFHPLKSGRNPRVRDIGYLAQKVSIPSSRVGTPSLS